MRLPCTCSSENLGDGTSALTTWSDAPPSGTVADTDAKSDVDTSDDTVTVDIKGEFGALVVRLEVILAELLAGQLVGGIPA